MALFGKKNDEEEDYEDDEGVIGEERRDKKLTRKFKDLNSKNKKKRKEPPKPWGKRERLIVALALLSTVVISAILAVRGGLRAFSMLSFDLPKINLDSLNPFKEETITIQKK